MVEVYLDVCRIEAYKVESVVRLGLPGYYPGDKPDVEPDWNLLHEPDGKVIAGAVDELPYGNNEREYESGSSSCKAEFHGMVIEILEVIESRVSKVEHGVMACQYRIPEKPADHGDHGCC